MLAAIEAWSESADLAEELVAQTGWLIDLVHPAYAVTGLAVVR